MKITILSRGDRSVGIPDGEWEVEEKGMPLPTTEAERAEKRGDYRYAWQYITDEPVGVYFEDECVDCRHILEDGKCFNPRCPSCEGINDDYEIGIDEDSLLDPEN